MISDLPTKNDRRVWQQHFGARHLSGDFYLLYNRDLPRAAYVQGGKEDECIRYFSDGTLFAVPPLWVILSDEQGDRILRYDNGEYRPYHGLVDWPRIRQSEPVKVTQKCARIIVDKILEDHRRWLSNPLSRAAIGSIPRVFSECTALIYELIQNAFDADATHVKIDLDHDTLRFYHDGHNFSEADANAISFVNLSSKDRDKTGFMGIGFKSVFEASTRPEIHSEPFSFVFDNSEEGGYILPQNTKHSQIPSPFTTLVHIPLKGGRIHDLINGELTPEETMKSGLGFSRKTFLHLLKERDDALAGITNVETPYVKFRIVKGDLPSSYQIVDVDGQETQSREMWLYFEKRFMPEREEVADFLRNRGIKNEDLEKEGWDETVSVMVPLAETDAGYSPVEDYVGILNVYLPTKIETGFGFDLQGNFIIQAGREKLKNIGSEWNRGLFSHVGEAVIKILEWCKSLGIESRVSLSEFYSLIPDWDRIEFLPEDIREEVKSSFSGLLNSGELIATESRSRGRTAFRRPGECIVVDDTVLELFSAETVEEVSGKKVVLRSLAKEARQRLLESSEVDQWDVERTVDFLSGKTWFRFLSNFKSKRAWNRWLSKLYAYLRTFLPESRYAGDFVDKKDRVLGCYIFPTGWSDSKKTYRLSRYRLPGERLYRLPREQAKLPLEAFYRISVLNQGFEDYVRGRPGKMTEEERSAVEDTRTFLERLEIQTLEPDIIARDFISPLFSDVSRHPKRSLVDYTCFVCEHKGEIKKESINLLLLNRQGEFRKPCDLLLGQAYGAFDTERFFGGAADDIFVSETYLDKTSISNKQWVDFFVWLGVNESLPLKTLKDVVPKYSIQERLGEHSRGLENMFLRSSYIDEDFPGNSFLIVDVDFSAPVVARLEAIRQLPLMSKIDCMRVFLRLLDEHWVQQYSKHLKVKVKYYAAYEHADSRPHVTPTGLNTRIATYLFELNWVPATSSDDLRKAEQVVALTDENAPLAEEGVVLCAERVKNESFLKFLGFRPAPAGVTTLHRLMNLKNAKSQNLDLYKELYGLICADTENGKLSGSEVRRDFNDNKLIYANGSFWAPDEMMFNPPLSLRLYFPVLSEVYPGMGEFFSKVLGCDNDNPSIDKILLYFLNFLWVTDRGMDDTLRASLLSCYRKLLDYVGEQESSDYQDHPLWRRFIGECKVFCRRVGWTSSRIDKPVVFLDVPKTRIISLVVIGFILRAIYAS